MAKRNALIAVGVTLLIILMYSLTRSSDRGTWLMEVAPVVIAVPILFFTYHRFPLTTLLYALIFCHALILIVGGTYTYAHVPLGFWLQDLLSLGRNPYDKIGHFAQGFVPALIAREIFIRCGYVSGRKMVAFLALCVAMAISAWYELIEWLAAIALGQGADEFLGTQGDPWDTQSDMLFAFIGASIAMLLLSRLHDRHIATVEASSKSAINTDGPAGRRLD